MQPNPSDSSQFQDLSSLHHYRTEIPNIVFHLRLDVWVFKAYCVFKMTAGDRGACFKSNKTLSDEIGCSIPTLIKLKTQLVEEGLITLIKRKHENGGDMPDLIQIVDLWPQNMEYMAKLYPAQKSSLKPWKQEEGGKPDLVGGVKEVNGGGKPGLHKQDHKEEKQKEQQQAAVVVSLFLEKIDIPQEEKIWLSKNYADDVIRNAVEFATHPLTVINTSLLQTIKWACKKNPKIPVDEAAESLKRKDEEREYFLENQRYAEKLAKEYYQQTKDVYGIRLAFDNVELDLRGNGHSVKIYFGDKQFKQLIEHELRKGK